MFAALMMVVFSRIGPMPPMIAPRDCKVSATETQLVVNSAGTEARLTFGEGELPNAPGQDGPPRLTVLPAPGHGDRLYAAVRDRWDGVAPLGLGHLYEITCGRAPSVRIAMVAPGLDFGRIALLRDGRWVVGGWGGLRVLDPVGRRLTPLTSPPRLLDSRCWSAEEGKPAAAADIPIVDEKSGIAVSAAAGEHELRFARGGACGYEATMLLTPFALAVDRGVVRAVREVRAFAWTGDGGMLVGDGGGHCEAQTAGTLWASPDGERWARLEVRDGGGGIAGLVRLARKEGAAPWLALTSICQNGGAKVGGDIYLSEDLRYWEKVLGEPPPPATPPVDQGAGVVELRAGDGETYARIDGRPDRLEQKAEARRRTLAVHWLKSTDGRTWSQTPKPTAADKAAARRQLAGGLGVSEVFGMSENTTAIVAWTSDGLFRQLKGKPNAAWVRIFPR